MTKEILERAKVLSDQISNCRNKIKELGAVDTGDGNVFVAVARQIHCRIDYIDAQNVTKDDLPARVAVKYIDLLLEAYKTRLAELEAEFENI